MREIPVNLSVTIGGFTEGTLLSFNLSPTVSPDPKATPEQIAAVAHEAVRRAADNLICSPVFRRGFEAWLLQSARANGMRWADPRDTDETS